MNYVAADPNKQGSAWEAGQLAVPCSLTIADELCVVLALLGAGISLVEHSGRQPGDLAVPLF